MIIKENDWERDLTQECHFCERAGDVWVSHCPEYSEDVDPETISDASTYRCDACHGAQWHM